MEIFAHILATIFLVNSTPHLIHGVCGYEFHSPFADPPFVGRSSPRSNVLWGGLNFVIGTALLFGVASFEPGFNFETGVLVLVGLFIASLIGRRIELIRHRDALAPLD